MFTKTNLLASVAAVTFAFTAQMASAGDLDSKKVVVDSRNNVVLNTAFRTCVRFDWEEGKDVCAPEQPAQAPAPVERTVLRKNEKVVYFEFDSATLTEEGKRNLNNVAKALKGAKDVQSAKIVGYADRIGSTGYNEELSKRRANAVQDYLAAQGYFNTSIAEVRAVGESQPSTTCDSKVAKNEQISCLSPDRRVEVEILYHKLQQAEQ